MRLPLIVLLALPTLGFAQGTLTPPSGAFVGGAPAPTMKSLDQIEARTPLGAVGGSFAAISIDSPGSYVLLGNLSVRAGDGITINSDNVTLDLNGFTISSSANPASGIAISISGAYSAISIRNGHIRGTTNYTDYPTPTFTGGGFNSGIVSGFAYSRGQGATGIAVVGVAATGIRLSSEGSTITDCTVTICGGSGLSSTTVHNSSAITCGAYAISAHAVANCYATCVAPSSGYSGIYAQTVTNSFGTSTSGNGIYAETATNCYGTSTSGTGLSVDVATNCSGQSTTGTGLLARVATGSAGNSTSGSGLQVSECAIGCSGTTSTGAYGVWVGSPVDTGTADNCRGTATGPGRGLSAENATNCFGRSSSGLGVYAITASNCSAYTGSGDLAMDVVGAATNCRAVCSKAGGKAIRAAVAVSCTTGGGTIDAPQKFLGTP
jgi:hypothetical protein